MSASTRMRILTDCADAREEWSGPGSWRRESPRTLPEAERRLWAAFGFGEEIWVGERPSPAGFWPLLLVAAEAPDSQFDVLRRLLSTRPAPPRPLACLALGGRRFHGHRGREWIGAPGNLHLSVALDSGGLTARHGAALTMLPAVAVAEALTRASGGALRPGIKWINDIVIAGAKIAGVLTTTQVLGDRLTGIVLGVGVNVAVAPEVPPTPFVPAIGSLARAGAEMPLPQVLGAVLESLAIRFAELVEDGPTALHEAYRRLSVVIGRDVCVWDDIPGAAVDLERNPPRARGIVRDIGTDLALRLEGVAEPVTRGRLAFAGSDGGA